MATTPQRAAIRTADRPHTLAPVVSVVVINYYQWRNTDRVARQLLDSDAVISGAADIVVIDNNSPYDPACARLKRTPGVALKRFDRNTGFSKAANEGCRIATGEWILLLNPDTQVSEGFLDQLEALCRTLADEDPRIGVVGLGLLHGDGSVQPSVGLPPTFGRTLGRVMLPRRIRKCRAMDVPDRVAVPWVTGCGMLVKRACWADLGGFDESFFLYYEDADFCRRAWEAGWSVQFEPSLRITHFQPLHTRPVPPELRLMTRHALLNYAEKYWSPWQTKAMATVIWLEAVARQARGFLRGKPATMHAELRRLAAEWLGGRLVAARGRIRRTAGQLARCVGREDLDQSQVG